jgi:hypothetical protein
MHRNSKAACHEGGYGGKLQVVFHDNISMVVKEEEQMKARIALICSWGNFDVLCQKAKAQDDKHNQSPNHAAKTVQNLIDCGRFNVHFGYP